MIELELKYKDLFCNFCNKCSYKKVNLSGKINLDVPPCEDRDCFLRQVIIALSKSENFELKKVKPILEEMKEPYIIAKTLVDISPKFYEDNSILSLFNLATMYINSSYPLSYFLLYVSLPKEVYKKLENKINNLFRKIDMEKIDDVSKLYLAMRIGNFLEKENLTKLLKSISCGYLQRAAESYTWKKREKVKFKSCRNFLKNA